MNYELMTDFELFQLYEEKQKRADEYRTKYQDEINALDHKEYGNPEKSEISIAISEYISDVPLVEKVLKNHEPHDALPEGSRVILIDFITKADRVIEQFEKDTCRVELVEFQ